tara:strand:- start:59 stop:193 length:135 start_codon:yes stop_codon:yes gene_type:complete
MNYLNKGREEKSKRKVEVVKAFEKGMEAYQKTLNETLTILTFNI